MPSRGLFQRTVRGLLEPRRLVPILLLATPMLFAQGSLSRDPLAVPLGLAMVSAFLLLAPWAWRFLLPQGLPARAFAARLALYVTLGFAITALLGIALPRALGMGTTFLTGGPSLLICAALFGVGGWALARDLELEERLTEARLRTEQAELLALRAHLDPHFLFNTLNAIAEWCRQDGEVAERAVLQLSAMLRSVLEGVRAPGWPLARELELVRTLFALHLLRDPALFRLEWPVDAIPVATVPPLLLLPLAENAVKHGPAAGHRGVIRLRVESAAGAIRLRFENPGPYRGPRAGSEGIPVVEKRLAHAYGAAARLALRGEGARTIAEVVLPLAPGREGDAA